MSVNSLGFVSCGCSFGGGCCDGGGLGGGGSGGLGETLLPK